MPALSTSRQFTDPPSARPVDRWRDAAACRSSATEVFFPISDLPGHLNPQVQQAKQICSTCPVQLRCLTWAMTTPEQFGIWGGTTPAERRRWRQQGER